VFESQTLGSLYKQIVPQKSDYSEPLIGVFSVYG